MDFTHATVIVKAANQEQAKADLGEGFFNTPLSPTGELPATDFVSSGPFDNVELNQVCNVVAWPKKVYFGGDWQAAIAAEGLQVVLVQPEN